MKPNINLDFYAEGNVDFKRKLAALLILSVQELQRALDYSLSKNDPEVFKRACHKEKTTITILGSSDFFMLTLEITACISATKDSSSLNPQLKLFTDFCRQATKELEKELQV